MKKGLIIIIILLELIIFKDIPGVLNIIQVNADEYQVYTGYPNETDEYIANINNQFYSSLGLTAYNRAIAYNCTSTSTCTGSISNQELTSGGLVWNGSMANYGFDIAHDNLTVLASNHLYSYSYVFCVPSGITDFTNRIFINTGLSSTRANEQTLITTDWYALNNITWYNYDSSGANNVATNKCYSTYNLFNYTGSNAYTIKFNLHTSTFNNRYIGILGYRITDLGPTNGVTASQVQSIVNNSGLATASSITDVQASINDVQDQLDDVNSSIQDQIQADAENTQAQIDSQKVCTVYDKSNIELDNKYLNQYGAELSLNEYGITNSIKINSTSTIKVITATAGSSPATCFYNINKSLISCVTNGTLSNGYSFTIPQEASYVRFSIQKASNRPQFQVCNNGNQAIMDTDHSYNNNPSETIEGQEEIDDMTDAEENLMNNIDLSGANNVNITINPNASSFIWQIVENLRNMNSSIILLWTSILGLGIIKLILNR